MLFFCLKTTLECGSIPVRSKYWSPAWVPHMERIVKLRLVISTVFSKPKE
jgi:hypothetical protein